MEFFEHLKTYLNDEEIALLKASLNQKSRHALLLNTEKMSQEQLLSLFPRLERHPVVKNAFTYDKDELNLDEFSERTIHTLSGGEFQKIVVARAFARQCPVKVFDEPSSALDPIAEYKLFDNILKACKENTLLFISHRLSSVQNADYVFLLENGKVKEEGTHRSLMKKKGLYADMYQKQAENYLADSRKQKEGIWA